MLKASRGSRTALDAKLFPLYDSLLDIDAALGSRGGLITAGTPALLSSTAHDGLRKTGRHRVSAGTVVFGDIRASEECPVGLEHAAVVAARCVSEPCDGVVTFDAGVKALAADAGDPICAVIGRPDLRPLKGSEEHLPVAVDADPPTKGDVRSPRGRFSDGSRRRRGRG